MIPPLSEEGSMCDPADELSPGVFGYAIRSGDAIYIPDIRAKKEGSGAVGRFLDSLDASLTWRIPNVISARLEGMLIRRGFVRSKEFAMGEEMVVFQKSAREAGGT